MKSVYAYLHDGLGNQCFIYAAARALALRAGVDLVLNTDRFPYDGYGRRFALEPFHCVLPLAPVRPYPVRVCEGLRSRLATRFGCRFGNYVCEARPFRYRPLPTDWRGRLVLDGYWQSELYFADCKEQIVRDFRLKDEGWLRADALAGRIRQAEHSIFLHVRSYKEVPGREDGQCALRLTDYYRNALRFLAERVPGGEVFVFSDDLPWARRHVLTDEVTRGLPFAFVYDDGASSQLRDFTLMRLCRHGIVADSSFSWWAGWLGEQEWLARGATAWRLRVDRRVNNYDFWPARWVAVPGCAAGSTEKSADNADGHGKGTGYPRNPCKSVDERDWRASADNTDGHGRGRAIRAIRANPWTKETGERPRITRMDTEGFERGKR